MLWIVVGKRGSGKSTFANAINQFSEDVIMSDAIMPCAFDDNEAVDMSNYESAVNSPDCHLFVCVQDEHVVPPKFRNNAVIMRIDPKIDSK
jgi:septin family protein